MDQKCIQKAALVDCTEMDSRETNLAPLMLFKNVVLNPLELREFLTIEKVYQGPVYLLPLF